MTNDRKDDELLRRAQQVGRQAEEFQRNDEDNHASASEKLIRDNKSFQKLSASADALRKYLGPIGSLLVWLANLAGKWCRWAAFVPASPGNPEGSFSGKRLALRALFSLVVVFAAHVTLKAAYYYATYFDETVYVTGKQEIETGELYQFGGCTSLPCSTQSDNGKFYLIESSLYFPVMYYPEENVFANIPQQDAACRVEGYGLYFRSLRWIYKSLQLYQHVVDVSCRPYTEEEIRRAVSEGEIVRDN